LKSLSPIATGSLALDRLLKGGIQPKQLTLVYGEPKTGKTTLCIGCASNCASIGMNVLFVDSDHTFYPERLAQIAGESFKEASERILVLKPETFQTQSALCERLDQYACSGVELVIVDTITSLYRVELSTRKEAFSVNRELNRQLAYLSHWAETLGLAVLATSQVRGAVEGGGVDTVVPVATRVVRHWASNILRLELLDDEARKATLEKAEHLPLSGPFALYTICEIGIKDLEK